MREDSANIQWYPGHMTRARRMMEENIKLIDVIIELVDARIPVSSRNPDIDRLGSGKLRLVLLNKADLADQNCNALWLDYFEGKGYTAVQVDSRHNKGIQTVQKAVEKVCREKTERDRKRGILNRPVRCMVAGIPNVGKSTFINSFSGRASAKTGNKPGVTKGKQWIRRGSGVELLDTPGILWPRFDDPATGRNLALVGSINDDILNLEELAMDLTDFLSKDYPHVLPGKYGQDVTGLSDIARIRGCLKKGGEADLEKAAGLLLDDFRNGRLGRISLEKPPKED